MDDLQRARLLLSEKRLGFKLQESEPDILPSQINALDGIKFVADSPDVTAVVYTFEDWPEEEDIVKVLEKEVPSDDAIYTTSGINGTLLFWGMTRLDGPLGGRAEDRLDEMLSAFSGSE